MRRNAPEAWRKRQHVTRRFAGRGYQAGEAPAARRSPNRRHLRDAPPAGCAAAVGRLQANGCCRKSVWAPAPMTVARTVSRQYVHLAQTRRVLMQRGRQQRPTISEKQNGSARLVAVIHLPTGRVITSGVILAERQPVLHQRLRQRRRRAGDNLDDGSAIRRAACPNCAAAKARASVPEPNTSSIIIC